MRPFLALLLVVAEIAACSWDYPVWSKSKQSDTPLFRFVVNEHSGAGYIDRQGRVVIPPQFSSLGNKGGDFFDGIASVFTPTTKFYYIDATGKRVTPPTSPCRGRSQFAEGLAACRFPDVGKTGFVDRSGKVVVAPAFDDAGDFSEGLARVQVAKHWGYIDKKGNFVVPAKLGLAGDFHDGHAFVILKGPCQYIRYGPCEYPFHPPYDIHDERPGAVQPAKTPRCRYSVIDKTGKVLFTGRFIDATHFSEGLAHVSDGKKWGFVDHSGRLQIPLQFEAAGPFSEGLAQVRVIGKWGFINHSGRFVIKPQFRYAEGFSEGMAVVINDDNKSSFIDKNGKRTIPGSFDAASSFVMGLAHVRVGKGYYSARWSYYLL